MLDDAPAPDAKLESRPSTQLDNEIKPASRPPAQSKLPASPGAATPRRRQAIGLVVLVALAACAYFGASWWTVGRYLVTTDDAYVGARAANISPKVGGYVTEVAVADNASIKTGDVIARIDAGDYQLALRSARDQSETQRSTIARIEKQTAAQQSMVDQARAQAASAKAAAVKAELDFKRQSDLAARQINSVQAFDQAKAARDQAVAGVAAAEASVAAAIANVSVLSAQRVEAANLLKQNETAVAKAERDLTFTEIRAPFDGVFGNRAVQVGDYVQPAQRLASLVPLKDVYIDANFKETQLSRVQVDQKVKITVDALGSRVIDGRVVSVAPASGSVFSLLPPDNATGNFTKVVQRITVRIAVPGETAAQLLLRPGMSVIVSVDTKPGKDAPAQTARNN